MNGIATTQIKLPKELLSYERKKTNIKLIGAVIITNIFVYLLCTSEKQIQIQDCKLPTVKPITKKIYEITF